jgi:hypothetical protein
MASRSRAQGGAPNWRRQASGLTPVARRKCRRNDSSDLKPASVATGPGGRTLVSSNGRATSSRGNGRPTNLAGSPRRCGGTTRRGATGLAKRGPWSRQTRGNLMSRPAAEPADVNSDPSSTYDELACTSMAGKRCFSVWA